MASSSNMNGQKQTLSECDLTGYELQFPAQVVHKEKNSVCEKNNIKHEFLIGYIVNKVLDKEAKIVCPMCQEEISAITLKVDDINKPYKEEQYKNINKVERYIQPIRKEFIRREYNKDGKLIKNRDDKTPLTIDDIRDIVLRVQQPANQQEGDCCLQGLLNLGGCTLVVGLCVASWQICKYVLGIDDDQEDRKTPPPSPINRNRAVSRFV
ncbi:hypothetical protein [Candidatus Neptunochlamydia vexilliferae]|uniref:Uncharacterized protein n=1 Tax=Candidatus Neptunichlamydia vexilliferae TaxID=1651774 RepID=A0ABS0AX67_9BACT|nr:hypothetical protein [Candidatus Neptunochlamydia vexilliferae]MBF5058560.1 hypothetical protein [Candidatus Neptunochlamydia vexilliferae]